MADIYAPIRSGTDITFLSGVLLYLIENNKINAGTLNTTPTPTCWCATILPSKMACSAATMPKSVSTISLRWNYQFDENSYAMRDETLQHPRCVWNLLKQHVSLYAGGGGEYLRYAKGGLLKVCEVLASTSAADRTTTFLYALGWTQHTVRAQNIRTMAMIQLLLGNMGMAGGGVNAARALQYSGANRFRPALDQPAGLPDAAVGTADGSAAISPPIRRRRR